MAKKRLSTSKRIKHSNSNFKKLRRIVNNYRPAPIKRLENALNASARLESLTRRSRPRIYENKNLIDKPLKKYYNSRVLNFKTEKEVCRARQNRKRDIMRITKGAGLRVRYARWNPDSYIICVR